MLKIIISTVNSKVTFWKKNLVPKKATKENTIDLTKEVSDLITECVLQCVFGLDSESLGKLGYKVGDKVKEVYPGEYLKMNFVDTIRR